MSIIPNQTPVAGALPRHNSLADAQLSNYVQKQSVNTYQSLDAGLKIETKEGDIVTLTSNTFEQLNAQMYNSRGVLQTESGSAGVTRNSREIMLTSGDSFSFVVQGDLSEKELSDIEAIVKGVDEIISEMAQGDMDDAVDKALAMGGYDTVSMYAADISYQRSYQMTSQVQAETMKTIPESKPAMLPSEDQAIKSVKEPFPENGSPHKRKNNTIKNIKQFVEKIADRLEKHLDRHPDKLVEKAQKPVDKLFQHHLENVKEEMDDDHNKNNTYNAIDHARKKIDQFIEKISARMFENHFAAFMESD